jgi:hypothetical protein
MLELLIILISFSMGAFTGMILAGVFYKLKDKDNG